MISILIDQKIRKCDKTFFVLQGALLEGHMSTMLSCQDWSLNHIFNTKTFYM